MESDPDFKSNIDAAGKINSIAAHYEGRDEHK